MTTYVYDEKRWDDTLELVDETAPYALTGAVSRRSVRRSRMRTTSRYSAGNFYVNDKPTGAAWAAAVRRLARERDERQGGSMWNLVRWVTRAR